MNRQGDGALSSGSFAAVPVTKSKPVAAATMSLPTSSSAPTSCGSFAAAPAIHSKPVAAATKSSAASLPSSYRPTISGSASRTPALPSRKPGLSPGSSVRERSRTPAHGPSKQSLPQVAALPAEGGGDDGLTVCLVSLCDGIGGGRVAVGGFTCQVSMFIVEKEASLRDFVWRFPWNEGKRLSRDARCAGSLGLHQRSKR